MQLINSLDSRTHKPRKFTNDMERHIRVLAREIANILGTSSHLAGVIKALPKQYEGKIIAGIPFDKVYEQFTNTMKS